MSLLNSPEVPFAANQRERIERLKRRVYALIVVLGLGGTVLGLAVFSAVDALPPVVTGVFVAAIVSDVAVLWGIGAGKAPLKVVEEVIYFTAGGLLVVVLILGLYLADDALQARIAVTGFYLWMPVAYIVIFLTQDTRGALWHAVPLYALIACVSFPRVLAPPGFVESPYGVPFSLAQLYLSSAVMISTLFLFSRIKDWLLESEVVIERMKHLAETDDLTGLYNRRRVSRLLEEEMERGRRHELPLSIIVFDIDDFKRVNDEFGHEVGDAVLAEVARLVGENLRESDGFGRWGGEEFLIVAPETRRKSAYRLADRVRAIIEGHDFGLKTRISASFGVSEFGVRDSGTVLLKRADVALYRAKTRGKNRVETEAAA
ncbi:MAG: GGDEF domain-containing protein [Rubrobacteraceae bacterium]